TVRTLQGFKLAHELLLSAFLEGSRDSASQRVHVHRLGEDIMRAARSLKRFQLLMYFQSARDDHDGNKRQKLLEFGQKIEAQFSFGENMIQNNNVRCALRYLV